jgi:PTS system nitrogen regulatory IIA component
VDRAFLLEVLLARESLGSTGIGDGIAIPHIRNPLVLGVDGPRICLCFAKKPVDFDAIDKKPVNALFILISPTVREHLRLLARLSFALNDPGFRAAVSKRKPAAEIRRACREAEARLV